MYIYIAIYILYIVHVLKNSNFHVHKNRLPVPKQNNGLQPRKRMAFSPRRWMVTRWQSLLMDKQEGISDVGWMDFHRKLLLPETNSKFAPWKHLGFFLKMGFLLQGKEDYQ